MIERQTCKRCGHEWWPRSEKLPLTCPKCRSPYWNKPRRRNLVTSYDLDN